MSRAFDRVTKQFGIDLVRIEPKDWLEIDGDWDRYVLMKSELNRTKLDEVFLAEAASEEVQREVLQLVSSHLLKYTDIIAIMHDHDRPALLEAGEQVQEDLLILRKSGSSWRIAAATVCFALQGRLKEKFGQTLSKIHLSIPGFEPGARKNQLVHRILDNIEPGAIFERRNWDFVDSRDYSRLRDAQLPIDRDLEGRTYLRTERQTIRKLEESGDLLVTIRIHVDLLEKLENHKQGGLIAESLTDGLMQMNEDELRYKGLLDRKEALLDELDALKRNWETRKESIRP